MSDFVESAKNFVSATVSRTSWEAKKQLRVRGKQGELDKLLKQRRQLLEDMTQTVMNLYQQGALSDAQLSHLCASILDVDRDIKDREAQLQEIRSETYPKEQTAPAPSADYTPPPASPSPAAPQTPPSGASPQSSICPKCGSAVRPNALYCRSCGAKLR